ncbi:hypothetical protein ACQ4PT_007261 [Festuca glaucescens]
MAGRALLAWPRIHRHRFTVSNSASSEDGGGVGLLRSTSMSMLATSLAAVGPDDASAMASNSNAGSAAGGGEQSAVQILNDVRVIPPNDDPKWPLWRSYSRVKTHLLKLGGGGVKPCPKVTIDVLVQLKDEQDKADASNNMPNNIPLPNDGNGRKRKASAIEECYDLDSHSKLDALIARMFYTACLPFNLTRNPWFRQAFTFAVNSKLAGYVPPSYNKLRTTLLVQEKTQVERMLQPIKSTWSSKGITLKLGLLRLMVAKLHMLMKSYQ